MKRFLVFLILGAAVLQAAALQDMPDSSAMTKAQALWGNAARIERTRKFGDSNWTFRVGFDSLGCHDDFTIVGSGGTWMAAFTAAAGKEILGTYSGKTFLMTASGTFGQTTRFSFAFSSPIQFQFLLDGQPAGPKLIPDRNEGVWTASTSWDSTTVTNGFHVVCGAVYSSDGSFGATNAGMVKVQN